LPSRTLERGPRRLIDTDHSALLAGDAVVVAVRPAAKAALANKPRGLVTPAAWPTMSADRCPLGSSHAVECVGGACEFAVAVEVDRDEVGDVLA